MQLPFPKSTSDCSYISIVQFLVFYYVILLLILIFKGYENTWKEVVTAWIESNTDFTPKGVYDVVGTKAEIMKWRPNKGIKTAEMQNVEIYKLEWFELKNSQIS